MPRPWSSALSSSIRYGEHFISSMWFALKIVCEIPPSSSAFQATPEYNCQLFLFFTVNCILYNRRFVKFSWLLMKWNRSMVEKLFLHNFFNAEVCLPKKFLFNFFFDLGFSVSDGVELVFAKYGDFEKNRKHNPLVICHGYQILFFV